MNIFAVKYRFLTKERNKVAISFSYKRTSNVVQVLLITYRHYLTVIRYILFICAYVYTLVYFVLFIWAIFHYHFHFQYNQSCNTIKNLFFGTFLSNIQPQGGA